MMLKSRLSQLLRYALLVIALVGLVVSLFAPGWWLALPFALLILGFWFSRPFPFPETATPRIALTQMHTREPDTYRSLEWKGLIFRSESEIKIAKTLDHRGIFFIPPARVRLNRGRDERMTRELDFVICHEGKWGVLEVDGPFHEAKADAERDKLLRAHGISSIQRFPSLRCFEQPNAVVDQFLFDLEHHS